MNINISKEGIVEYYNNKIGYVKDNRAVLASNFKKEAIEEYMAGNGFSVQWRDDVYERMAKGNFEEATTSLNCRLYRLKPESDLRMRFVGYKELKQKGFGEPNIGNYKIVYDGNAGTDNPEEIYTKFANYELSGADEDIGIYISDVIELYDDDQREFFYINPYGFVNARKFLEPKQNLVRTEAQKEENDIAETKEPAYEQNTSEFEDVNNEAESEEPQPGNDTSEEEEFQVETFKITM